MKALQRVLILGTGSAAVQLAVNFKNRLLCTIGIAGRISVRSKEFFSELHKTNNKVCVHVQNKNHSSLSGECFIDNIFIDYKNVSEEWDTIILAVTSDAYISVIKQLEASVIRNVRCIIMVSPTIGSNSLISAFLKQVDSSAEVVSFSTYYAATKERNSSADVLTKGVKKKIYIGSTNNDSEICRQLLHLFKQLDVSIELVKSPYEAESKNISIYVHPPIFMNDYALNVIFREEKTVKYAYKFYPEGPLTQYVIRDILEQWKEIMKITGCMGVTPFNLLKFMVDDNYPVKSEMLSRDDIDNFMTFNNIKQEYLLYIRYTAILIDPFSIPDEYGRYFDFSAVPIPKIYQDTEGYWRIPRIPKEDYYRIKILQGIAVNFNLRIPIINKIINTYENRLKRFSQVNKDSLLSIDFTPASVDAEVAMICNINTQYKILHGGRRKPMRDIKHLYKKKPP